MVMIGEKKVPVPNTPGHQGTVISATESEPPFKIGELLVREGFVSKKDIRSALEIQKKEMAETNLPLGALLIKKRLITKEQLKILLDHPYLRKDMAKIAFDKGMIDNQQIVECMKRKAPDETTDECLIRLGYISDEHLKILKKHYLAGIKTGELALKLNMISEVDLETVLNFKRSLRTIGEILCDLKMITPFDLNNILSKYNKKMKLGEFFLNQDVIEKGQLHKALDDQQYRGEKLGQILLENNLISENQLYSALSRLHSIPFRKLHNFSYELNHKKSLIDIVGKKYSEKNNVIPLSLNGKALTLALINPENIRVVQELQRLYSHIDIQCALITQNKFAELFPDLYGEDLYQSDKSDLKEKSESIEQFEISLEDDDPDDDDKTGAYGFSDMEAEEIVNYIIKYGIANGASDIHIEQDKAGAMIRYRVDGVLQKLKQKWLNQKLKENINPIVSRIKVISKLDIAERRKPQDGVFRINYLDKTINKQVDLDFRVAVCPAIVGENITIRILDSRKAKVGLDNLGHSHAVLSSLKSVLKSSAGMLLVCGPTGSGKSSTLYGALQHIYNPSIKIITAEDPIEYSFQGIMQTQANQKIDLTFAKLLRSFLRLDPDVILVGEMRDLETASIGFDAAQTGHLLLSTIHTNDAVGAIPRLMDLGIERNQIASCLIGVLAQRLIRRICTNCRTRYVPEEKEWGLLFRRFPSHLEFYQSAGCSECDHTGYHGRLLLSEFFNINKDVVQALNSGASENEIKSLAIRGGMKTMVDDGILKLDQTTLSEIIRVVPHEMIKEFRLREKKDEYSPAPPDSEFIIVSDSDNKLINMMYKRYQKLNEKVGVITTESDFPLFERFILESYKNICEQHNCSRVIFHLVLYKEKVGISAKPN